MLLINSDDDDSQPFGGTANRSQQSAIEHADVQASKRSGSTIIKMMFRSLGTFSPNTTERRQSSTVEQQLDVHDVQHIQLHMPTPYPATRLINELRSTVDD